MKNVKQKISVPEGQRTATVNKTDAKALATAKAGLRSVNNLSKYSQKLDGRRVNVPESISETLVCAELGFLKKARHNSGSFKKSWDAYNPATGKRVQIKCSTIKNDLSSFGPRSKFDELYFVQVDFKKRTYSIFHLPENGLKKIKVNQKQTLGDFQKLGKRPRFCIQKQLISKYQLKPVKVGKF